MKADLNCKRKGLEREIRLSIEYLFSDEKENGSFNCKTVYMRGMTELYSKFRYKANLPLVMLKICI
jgi:hypothetical protein